MTCQGGHIRDNISTFGTRKLKVEYAIFFHYLENPPQKWKLPTIALDYWKLGEKNGRVTRRSVHDLVLACSHRLDMIWCLWRVSWRSLPLVEVSSPTMLTKWIHTPEFYSTHETTASKFNSTVKNCEPTAKGLSSLITHSPFAMGNLIRAQVNKIRVGETNEPAEG